MTRQGTPTVIAPAVPCGNFPRHRRAWHRRPVLRRALALALVLASAGFAPSGRAPRPSRVWNPVLGVAPAPRAIAVAPALHTRIAVGALTTAGWRVQWSDRGDRARSIWGAGVVAPGASADPAIAEAAARAFIADHAAAFAPALAGSELVVVANQRDGAVRSVGFAQRVHGVPIVDAQLGVMFRDDHLIAVSSRLEDTSMVAAADVAQPRHPRAAMIATAMAARELAVAVDVAGAPARVALPIALADGSRALRVADAIEVREHGGPGQWTIYVAADGTALVAVDELRYATSPLQLDAAVRYPTAARTLYPAPDLAVTIDGSATFTDDAGVLTWPTSVDAAVTVPSVSGSYVLVIDRGAPQIAGALTASPGVPTVWSVASDPLADAELSAYAFGSIAHTRATRINPTIASWLAATSVYYVNEPGECNAYSTGDNVHFLVGSTTCENTGRIADVVFHEFGHMLHKHSIIAGVGAYDIPLSEGLADYNASNITEDPGIGRGMWFSPTAVRDIDPPGFEHSWPLDQDPDPHLSGEIVSGALWDLRKLLVRELGHDAGVAVGEEIFAGVLARAADIPGSYVAALIADDNDGNLGNGTPHQCAIDRAFAPHGLVPGFAGTSLGTPTFDGQTVSIAVAMPADPMNAACPPRAVTAMAMSWQLDNGVPGELPMTEQAGTWSATLPPLGPGHVLHYAIEVTFDDGALLELPANPADPTYVAYIGDTTPIWCEMFDADPHWIQSGVVGDEWQFAFPNALPSSDDPMAAHTGSHVVGTSVTGFGLYDSGDRTSIQTPTIDVTAFDTVRLQYWRWLAVEDAHADQATIEVNGAQIWMNATNTAGTLDHIDREWQFQDFDISPLVLDGTATVSWTLTTNAVRELGGWSIDDVCLVGLDRATVCGDGIVEKGEQCDDGNTTSGDGCSSTCKDELHAGGGCAAGGGDVGGGLLVVSGALVVARLAAVHVDGE